MANFLTSSSLAESLQGNNPLWKQAQIQSGNQQFLADQAKNAYLGQMTGVPQQLISGMDPRRIQGMDAQIGAAQGTGAQLATQGAGTLGTIQGGAGAGQSALQGIAAGGMPQFGQGMAQGYQNFMNPSLLGAQQALNNQANMAWNKGAAGVGGAGGGFMSSGRNAALGQAQENAATQLGMNQQQLAFNAASAAANAGQQAGNTGYQGQLAAGQALGNQALQGAQLTNNLQQAQLMPGQVQEAAGVNYQNQNQNELNAQYQNQLAQFNNPFKSLQNYQAGLGVLGSTNYAPNLTTPANWQAMVGMLGGLGIDPQSVMAGFGKQAGQALGGLATSGINTIGGLLNGGSNVTGAPTVQTADQLGQGFADFMGSTPSTVQTADQMGQGFADWLGSF